MLLLALVRAPFDRFVFRIWVPFGLALLCMGCSADDHNRPEDVAKRAFLALQTGTIEPLRPFMYTSEDLQRYAEFSAEEAQGTIAVRDERWRSLIKLSYPRFAETATIGRVEVDHKPEGAETVVRVEIRCATGSRMMYVMYVTVSKVGRRWVFVTLHVGPPPPGD